MDYDNRTVSAFFDNMTDAQAAAAGVAALGIASNDIRIVEGSDEGSNGVANEGLGFWDSLADFFFPDEDRATYAEGLRRGGYVLHVSVSRDMSAQVADILNDEGVVDLDERSESWRSEGWDSTAAVAGYQTASSARSEPRRDMTDYGASTADVRDVTGDDKIAVTEERLRVGKREASGGQVRVRTYVVEEPVSEDVTLRDERVTIKRTPVDRAADGADAFRDTTISAEEHVEEAVVSKEARVVEEIALEKETRSRTETVSDSVRKTKVEIDDERAGVASGTMSRSSSQSGI